MHFAKLRARRDGVLLEAWTQKLDRHSSYIFSSERTSFARYTRQTIASPFIVRHFAMSTEEAVQPTASTSYLIPNKRILSPAHLAAFTRSRSHNEIIGFVNVLNANIIGRTLSEAGEGSEVRLSWGRDHFSSSSFP